MKIGLNLLYLIPGVVGGVQTYAEGLLSGLAELNDGNEYFVLLNREAAELTLPASPRFHRVVVPVTASNQFLRYSWEQFRLPGLARREGLDVLHSLGYVGPLKSPCATVLTVHDLNFIRLGRYMPVHRRLALAFFCRMAATRAEQVITVSEFSRRELCAEFGVDSKRVSVVYHGSAHSGYDLGVGENAGAVPDLPAHYMVAFAGGGNPHKNIARLIQALDSAFRDLPHRLVLIGKMCPSDVRYLNGRVISLGSLSATAVQCVLEGAELFVMPSLYEGFGLPVIEAQRAGVAVACSNVASLPEVAGDGAVYFSPESVTDISRAIRLCLTELDLRRQLIARGTANVQRFSWLDAARQTLRAYELAYQERHTRVGVRHEMEKAT